MSYWQNVIIFEYIFLQKILLKKCKIVWNCFSEIFNLHLLMRRGGVRNQTIKSYSPKIITDFLIFYIGKQSPKDFNPIETDCVIFSLYFISFIFSADFEMIFINTVFFSSFKIYFNHWIVFCFCESLKNDEKFSSWTFFCEWERKSRNFKTEILWFISSLIVTMLSDFRRNSMIAI